jgi:hypothetical protein
MVFFKKWCRRLTERFTCQYNAAVIAAPGNVSNHGGQNKMQSHTQLEKTEVYTRYPAANILVYHGVTFLHFCLGGIGIAYGYNTSPLAAVLGGLYLVFAFGQMYVLMPLMVCRNCVYYGLEDARCISAMNLIAKRIVKQGDPQDFPNRARGLLCHNNLYLAALISPIILMIPALIMSFSFMLLAIWLAVIGLLLRFFVIFTRVACVHCQAKHDCPNAERTGVRDL